MIKNNPDISIVDVVVDKINEDDANKIVKQLSIEATPTTLFYKDGKLEKTIKGFIDEKELQNALDSVYKK